jgi:hypothetical protein
MRHDLPTFSLSLRLITALRQPGAFANCPGRHASSPSGGGLPSRTDYLPQQPPRKKVTARKTTTAIITHSI